MEVLINNTIGGNTEECYGTNERVAVNKRSKLQVAQAYLPTFRRGDQQSKGSVICGLEIRKVKTQCTALTGDFNDKTGKKQVEYQGVNEYGVGSRNSRQELSVKLAK